jgi:uncharacterized protein with PIN domain
MPSCHWAGHIRRWRRIGASVEFRAYGSLNDFLSPDRRWRTLTLSRPGGEPVRHIAGSLGIPHPEIGAVLLDGSFAGLDAVPSSASRIALYPPMEIDQAPGRAVRPPLPSPPSFVTDAGLGRLARLMRLLGFDTSYARDASGRGLAVLAAVEGRVLLSRNRRLLMLREVVHGFCPRSNDPVEQAAEVVRRFRLSETIRPFHRCSSCGGLIEGVTRDEVLDRLEPLTKMYYDDFWRCRGCGRIYWEGSHLPALVAFVARMRSAGH